MSNTRTLREDLGDLIGMVVLFALMTSPLWVLAIGLWLAGVTE